MAWKPKTIAGKILKGFAIGTAAVGVAVGGATLIAATGGAATPAVAGGVGLLGKLVSAGGKVVKTVGGVVGKGVGAVASGAANLVSGISAEQREMVKEQKAEAKEETQKITTIEKLIKAGASVTEAAAKVGVPLSDLKGLFGIQSEAQEQEETVKNEVQGISPDQAGQGCLITTLIILSGLATMAFTLIL